MHVQSCRAYLRSGGPRLKQTQTYPAKFGRKVSNLHLAMLARALVSDIFADLAVCYDDTHWARPGTSAALILLSRRLPRPRLDFN